LIVAAFGKGPVDLEPPTPAHAASVALLLLAVGALAAVVPVWRVLRTDPLLALRRD
jgi:hypothetical protein